MSKKKQETNAVDPALRYGEAVSELKEILARIESEETDLDDLADQVQRAAALLEHCRARIEKTEMSVNKIFEEMAGDEDEEAP